MNTRKRHVKTSRLAATMIFSFLLFVSAVWICVDGLLSISEGFSRSKTNETLTVPDLAGLEYTGESMADGGKNFTVVQEGKIESDAPAGSIVRQSPAPDVKRKKRDKPHVIRVTVSGAKDIPTVPDVKGLDVRDAKILLEDKGFKVSVKHAEQNFGSAQADRVLGSSPAAGEKIKSGGEVVLHVRQAAEVISVRCPDLTGMYLSDAISVLRAHGLKAGCVEHSDGDYFSSTVHSQGRPAGSYVPKGCAVDIVLAPSKPENTSENINNKLFFKQEVEKHTKFWRKKSFRWHTTRQEE